MQTDKTYVRIDMIRSSKEADTLLTDASVLGMPWNIQDNSWQKVLQMAELFELAHNPSHSSNPSHFAAVLTVMIPSSLAADRRLEFLHSTVEHYLRGEKLPCWFFFQQIHHGFYLTALILERPYHPEGIDLVRSARSDIYRSTRTGKLCKASDPDAHLIRHKGDVLSRQTVLFGNKTRLFALSAGVFCQTVSRIKAFVVETLRAFGAPAPHGFFLAKFRQASQKNLHARRAAAIWNAALCRIEDYLNGFYHACKVCDIPDAEEIVSRLQAKYRMILKSGKCVYQKRFNVVFEMVQRLSVIRDMADLFFRRFRDDLAALNGAVFGIA